MAFGEINPVVAEYFDNTKKALGMQKYYESLSTEVVDRSTVICRPSEYNSISNKLAKQGNLMRRSF